MIDIGVMFFYSKMLATISNGFDLIIIFCKLALMKTTELVELIDNLSADKKKVVEDLVAALISDSEEGNFVSVKKPKMKFGELKGFVTYIADDFDEPLEDFKDYM
jgi:hypothetical protein